MAELSGEFQDAKAALDGLDRLLQHQGRLGICVLLAGVDAGEARHRLAAAEGFVRRAIETDG